MSVRDTSLSAWCEVRENLSPRQEKVFHAIRLCGIATDRMISEVANLPINCVTPRRGELVHQGRVRLVMKSRELWPPFRVVCWWGCVR